MIDAPSPNYGAARTETLGVVLHSTRGGAATLEQEFTATLDWFGSLVSQVSAHIVIADDGMLAHVVDPTLAAWHAREYNARWLGAELVQPQKGDPISDAQYRTLAWWVVQMAKQFGFVLSSETLPEHWEIPPGVREGKTDIEAPFTRVRLFAAMEEFL